MEHSTGLFSQVLIFLVAAVITVPIVKRLGLGSVVGYILAGLVIGPSGLEIFKETEEVLHFAEIGVILLLFVIGLELQPRRLWSMKRDIFGLGAAQVLLSAGLLFVCFKFWGFSTPASVVVGLGLALSSTAFVLQLLAESGDMNSRHGQRAFSILLFQDLAIIPILALIAVMSPFYSAGADGEIFTTIATMLGAVGALILIGHYLLNPIFRFLAKSQAHEIMTAAALLIVLGSAALMQFAGLSMALGAFLAGVLLAESSYRIQLEADIEPFRGILMGLLFIAIGMSIDLAILMEEWRLVLFATAALLIVKMAVLYLLARLFKSDTDDALRLSFLLPQGGEFGFVMFSAATAAFILDASQAAVLSGVVIVTMILTPFLMMIARRIIKTPVREEMEEDFEGARGSILFIGFGRFGQIAAQVLFAEGTDVVIIDNDPERIRQAARFGFRVYYGDGARRDVLRKVASPEMRAVAVCSASQLATDQIIDMVREEMPLAKIFVRSKDRNHSLELRRKEVDFEIRETLESAIVFGGALLEAMGLDHERAQEIAQDVRKRDEARIRAQTIGGIHADDNTVDEKATPQPLTEPRRSAAALSEETERITGK